MTEKDIQRENMGHIESQHEEMVDFLYEEIRELRSVKHETMTNLALIAGGFATGAMILLDTRVPVNAHIVVVGIIFLLIDVIFIFANAFKKLNDRWKDIKKIKTQILKPHLQIKELFADYKEWKITGDEFDKQYVQIQSKMKKDMRQGNQKSLIDADDNKPLLAFLEWSSIAFFAVGVVLIIVGILAHYL